MKLVIIGAGGHGIAVSDAAIKQGQYEVLGFIDDKHEVGDMVNKLPVLASTDDFHFLFKRHGAFFLFLAIGDNYWRREVLKKVAMFSFATIIHPSAVVGGGTKIGEGTFIAANATIGAKSTIGKHVIINTAANADHENIIWDFSSLAPHACTGGRVTIGDCTAIGLNAVIQQQVVIGKHSIIGSCSYVNKDIGSNVVAYGTPCHVVRQRKIDEPYL